MLAQAARRHGVLPEKLILATQVLANPNTIITHPNQECRYTPAHSPSLSPWLSTLSTNTSCRPNKQPSIATATTLKPGSPSRSGPSPCSGAVLLLTHWLHQWLWMLQWQTLLACAPTPHSHLTDSSTQCSCSTTHQARHPTNKRLPANLPCHMLHTGFTGQHMDAASNTVLPTEPQAQANGDSQVFVGWVEFLLTPAHDFKHDDALKRWAMEQRAG